MLSDYFERELELIEYDALREAVCEYLDTWVGSWFMVSGASSSGKYHPRFSQGEGGLIRHTKAVVLFAEELLRMSQFSYMKELYQDFVIATCILHDTCKYGAQEYDKSFYPKHGRMAAQHFKNFCMSRKPENCDKYFWALIPEFDLLFNAIVSHMGQWTEDRDDRPFTTIDRCVHMADYMASRSFIDIPQIWAEYNAVGHTPNTDPCDPHFSGISYDDDDPENFPS